MIAKVYMVLLGSPWCYFDCVSADVYVEVPQVSVFWEKANQGLEPKTALRGGTALVVTVNRFRLIKGLFYRIISIVGYTYTHRSWEGYTYTYRSWTARTFPLTYQRYGLCVSFLNDAYVSPDVSKLPQCSSIFRVTVYCIYYCPSKQQSFGRKQIMI